MGRRLILAIVMAPAATDEGPGAAHEHAAHHHTIITTMKMSSAPDMSMLHLSEPLA